MYIWYQSVIILFWHTALYLQIIPTLRTYKDNANATAAVDVRTHSVQEHLTRTNSKADINNYNSDAGAAGPQVTRVGIFGTH